MSVIGSCKKSINLSVFFNVVGLCHVKDWNYAFKPAEYLKHKCTLEQLTTADLCVFIYKFVCFQLKLLKMGEWD